MAKRKGRRRVVQVAVAGQPARGQGKAASVSGAGGADVAALVEPMAAVVVASASLVVQGMVKELAASSSWDAGGADEQALVGMAVVDWGWQGVLRVGLLQEGGGSKAECGGGGAGEAAGVQEQGQQGVVATMPV
jgi:hypothetical protein